MHTEPGLVSLNSVPGLGLGLGPGPSLCFSLNLGLNLSLGLDLEFGLGMNIILGLGFGLRQEKMMFKSRRCGINGQYYHWSESGKSGPHKPQSAARPRRKSNANYYFGSHSGIRGYGWSTVENPKIYA